MLKDSQVDLCGRTDLTRPGPLVGVFVCLRGLRLLLPGAGGYRAVGL